MCPAPLISQSRFNSTVFTRQLKPNLWKTPPSLTKPYTQKPSCCIHTCMVSIPLLSWVCEWLGWCWGGVCSLDHTALCRLRYLPQDHRRESQKESPQPPEKKTIIMKTNPSPSSIPPPSSLSPFSFLAHFYSCWRHYVYENRAMASYFTFFTSCIFSNSSIICTSILLTVKLGSCLPMFLKTSPFLLCGPPTRFLGQSSFFSVERKRKLLQPGTVPTQLVY